MIDRLPARKVATIVVTILVLSSVVWAAAPLFTAGAGTEYEAPSGLLVVTAVDHSKDADNPVVDSDTIRMSNVSFSASGASNVTVDRFEGSWTNLSSMNVEPANVTVDPAGKQAVTVGGNMTAIQFRDMQLGGGADFVYSADDPATVTVTNLPANTKVTAGTSQTNALDTATTDGNGNATFTLNSATDQDVLLFTPSKPTVDNNSATPTGDLQQRNPTFSIDVNDSDFSTSHGDSITASLFVDGTKRGSDTITSNGSVSVSVKNLKGGDHTYYWQVNDSYNLSQQSQQFSIRAPGNLTVYKEQKPSERIRNADITIKYFFRDPPLIVNRSTSDGRVNMSGLPTNRPFVVVARADGYFSRRIFVESLFQQQKIYLLNDSASAVNPTFDVQDFTGRYPKESSALLVQRAINGSWQTVEGDYLGAAGTISTQLQFDVRHRLVIINTDTGRKRILGPYTPTSSTTVRVRVQSEQDVQIKNLDVVITVAPDLTTLPAQNQSVRVNIENASLDLSSYTVTYKLKTGGSNTTLTQVSGSQSSGELINKTLDLSNAAGGTLFVVTDYTLSDGSSGTETTSYRITRVYLNPYSLLNTLDRWAGAVPSSDAGVFTSAIGFLSSIAIAAAASARLPIGTELAGLIGVGALAGFAIVGWVGYGPTFIVATGWVGLTAIRRGI